MIGKKQIIAIDIILVVGILIAIGGAVFYVNSDNVAFSPEEDLAKTTALFRIEKSSGSSEILIEIDDNLEFNSPEEYYVRDGTVIGLETGKHYWGITKGEIREVRQFDLEVGVNFMFRELSDGSFQVINAGDSELHVDVYNQGTYSDSVILENAGGKNE
ncbi:MAG: hypothetical protein ABIH92_00515 [Nanoarchaeota archaeon]